MAIAYTEATADTFDPVANPTDWLEIIDSGSSPGSLHLSNDNQDCTLTGYVPWNKIRSCARWFLGYAYADADGSYLLHRENPAAHPITPFCWAYDWSATPFCPQSNPESVNGWPIFTSPFEVVNIKVAYHKLAIVTVRFRNFRMRFRPDSDLSGDPRNEWMRNTYIDPEPNVEALSADGISQLYFVEGGQPGSYPAGPVVSASGPVFPAPIAELLAKSTFVWNWLNVPFDYLSFTEDYLYPEKILACMGKVNSQVFPINAPSEEQFPIGTLLCRPPKFSIKTFPVAAADPTNPLLSVDVAIPMEYFNPTNGSPGSIYRGHNLMPWRANGLFYYCTRLPESTGAPPLLQSADFNAMFTHVDDDRYQP